jgi:hypothetical protein
MINGHTEIWDEIHKKNFENIEGLSAEITQEKYFDMLEVLPPLRMTEDGKCFYMCEFITGDLTMKYWHDGDKYFCMVVDFRKEFPKIGDKEYMMLR